MSGIHELCGVFLCAAASAVYVLCLRRRRFAEPSRAPPRVHAFREESDAALAVQRTWKPDTVVSAVLYEVLVTASAHTHAITRSSAHSVHLRARTAAAAGGVSAPSHSYTYITTAAALHALAPLLSSSRVIAVDLEHSDRSFHGYVATLQLTLYTHACVCERRDDTDDTCNCASSCTSSALPHRCVCVHDVLVDMLVPEVRDSVRAVLAPVFMSPHILKLTHGCANDVRWLHSNFGVFLLSCVDTSVIARMAGAHSLALDKLLMERLGVATDKIFARADWRTRPLPDVLVHYARTDTHFLAPLAAALLQACVTDRVATKGGAVQPCEVMEEALQRTLPTLMGRYDMSDRERFDASHWRTVLTKHAADSHGMSAFGRVVFLNMCFLRHVMALCTNEPVERCPDTATLLREVQHAVSGDRAPSSHSIDSSTSETLSAVRLALRTVRVDEATVRADGGAVLLPSVAAILKEELTRRDEAALNDAITVGMSLFSDNTPLEGSSAAAREALKVSRAVQLFVPRAAPLYNNIELLAPNDTVIARIDRRKAVWYVNVGAAVIAECEYPTMEEALDAAAMSDGGKPPLRLRLVKEPRGLGHAGDDFHLAPKSNQCVVCGIHWEAAEGVGGLNRCYIVPHALRQHLPLAAKSYTSHDVVLTCAGCHRRVDVCTSKLLNTLSKELGVPIRVQDVVADDADEAEATLIKRIGFLRRIASALTTKKELPADVRQQYTDELAKASKLAAAVNGALGIDSDAWSAETLRYLLTARPVEVARLAEHGSAAAASSASQYDFALHLVQTVVEGGDAWQRAESKFAPYIEPHCSCSALLATRGAPAPDVDDSAPMARCECGRSWADAVRDAAIEDDDVAVGVSGLTRAMEKRLARLVQRFRQHFVDSVNPVAMPVGWRINYRVFQAGLRRQDKDEPDLVKRLIKSPTDAAST